jgi:hypothetical protein
MVVAAEPGALLFRRIPILHERAKVLGLQIEQCALGKKRRQFGLWLDRLLQCSDGKDYAGAQQQRTRAPEKMFGFEKTFHSASPSPLAAFWGTNGMPGSRRGRTMLA